MDTYWRIETRGDPIGAVQRLIQSVWEEAHLDRMLTSENGSKQRQLLDHPAGLEKVNPFRPVMRENLAGCVPEILQQYPTDRIGVLLRPCEMRALVEMNKRQPLPRSRLITFCVDCLGTYPSEEYEWRTSQKEGKGLINRESLRFTGQEGIQAYRYRAACQICATPGAQSADINVHVLGLPVREQILVHTPNHETKPIVDLAGVTSGEANVEVVSQHQHMLARQAEIHQQTMERVMITLGDLLPNNVDQWITQLENCGDCQRCMTVCPICTAEFPYRDSNGHYPREVIQRWLISCAGCGMCEQACIANLPLGVIFGAIREKLKEQYHYLPGQDWGDRLPI